MRRRTRAAVRRRRGPRARSVAGLSANAVAVPSAKNSKKSQSDAQVGDAQDRRPQGQHEEEERVEFVAQGDGQALQQGDTISTDTTAGAEIDYTDGSLTRLGSSTEFKITKLTNKQGVRQTQGTLTVGETWNRAAKVAETGSFEVTAGGATAAVEGPRSPSCAWTTPTSSCARSPTSSTR